MEKQVDGYYEVSRKEKTYLALKIVFSIFIYLVIFIALFILFSMDLIEYQSLALYKGIGVSLLAFILIQFIVRGINSGIIKQDGVKITDRQFPDIYKIAESISMSLHLGDTPNMYLIQSGSLNAYALKFLRSNYVVIYSDLLEAYYEGDKDAVEFVIAHELGHIKRNHLLKTVLLAPANLVPFLNLAYKRGCELTCDNIGKYFNAKGAVNGLLILAGGRKLCKQIQLAEYMDQEDADSGFWRWFVGIFSTHPSLYKRLNNVYDKDLSRSLHRAAPKSASAPAAVVEMEIAAPVEEKPDEKKPLSDYERYMPR